MENLSNNNYYRKDEDTILDANEDVIYEDASNGKRFANYIIDSIAMYLLAVILLIIYIFTGNEYQENRLNDYLLGGIVVIIYYLATEGLTGRSLGKLITKTKVINMENEKPSFLSILGRSLARLILFSFI